MKIIFYLILTTLFFVLQTARVLAIVDPLSVPNNKFGIHILFTDEIQQAAKLVNSSGGDWGYVTIPLQAGDRNLEKWQKFMDKTKELHLIPIIRLTTIPVNNYWEKPTLYDSVDFANFLSSLKFPTKNRYVILFNEPNEAKEWGYEVNPFEYASYASDTIDIFKQRSSEFFLLNAGLDVSLPNSKESMDAYLFLNLMEQAVPGILRKFDGWNSHSYPNPNFSASPNNLSRYGIHSFENELTYLQNNFGLYGIKVFITETGWNQDVLGSDIAGSYFQAAFDTVWNKEYIVAVTPFLLSAGQGPFAKFSFVDPSFGHKAVYTRMQSMTKTKGTPNLSESLEAGSLKTEEKSNWSAQKTGIWNAATRQWIKNIFSYLSGQ